MDRRLPTIKYADVAELADAPDLESGGRPCGFESHHPHQKERSNWTPTYNNKLRCRYESAAVFIPQLALVQATAYK